jgi:hypothetical protein
MGRLSRTEEKELTGVDQWKVCYSPPKLVWTMLHKVKVMKYV